ncbi:MAG TPA: tetratricopeptide repeat protein [Candidatus Gastranaerophilaceae bacterium]|nr:tetratricopeptide repeat protein [Candidatus Gastranaerophilaceae bacterium]HPT41147.1 tetratricopeptide repeat protein [Candidatus Gastranaerophilaceae bacterium]
MAYSKFKLISLIILFGAVYFSQKVLAVDFSPINSFYPKPSAFEKTINLQTQKGLVRTIDLSDTYDFSNATDRFVQCNIAASKQDFRNIIQKADKNDFFYLTMADKMAGLGFFDLSDLAISKISSDFSKNSSKAIKRFYYPSKKLTEEQEILLAESYSNIIYNNQSTETVKELSKNSSLLLSSDYANYIMALGYYKTGAFAKANKYIDSAISKSPSTLNYQKLKVEILAETGRQEAALRIIASLKKQNLLSYEYERKINALEQYTLYKTGKTSSQRNYHLGYYYYLENDSSKAIKTLQTALSGKKGVDTQAIYSLMAKIYFETSDFEKASENVQKAYKIDKNNPQTLLILGDLNCNQGNFQQALKYYKQAASKNKKDYLPQIKEGIAWQKLSNDQKAKEIWEKTIKENPKSWQAYYYLGLLNENNSEEYFKQSLSINPMFKQAWIELAKGSISRQNYDDAKKYLSNAFCIDENDFRYYYYQGLVEKNTGNGAQAEYNFKKCLKLKSDFEPAKNELMHTEVEPNPITPVSQIK